MMIIGCHELGDYASNVGRQWLVANGLGGFASSTVVGSNTSKYHGLLFASLKPPVERTLLLAKLEEEVELEGETYLLGCNQTGTGVYPEGHNHLQGFELRPFPTYIYAFKNIILEKTVFMVRDANITIIRYTMYTGSNAAVRVRVTPFVNCRHYHHTMQKNDWPFSQETDQRSVVIEAYQGAPKLRLYSDRALYNRGPGYWFEGMFYAQEEERGLNPWEDHYMPGNFEIEVSNGESFSIIAAVAGERDISNPLLEQVSAERRLAALVEELGFHEEFVNRLVLAADTFIVRRESTGAGTVIAGYPWFTDWGRDTMIALPGLTLVTGRFAEAREILQTFANYCAGGLIPNMFPDQGGAPLYNTVDASLWFFHSVYKYLQYTGDHEFIKKEIYPVLREIIRNYRQGTDFNIGMDDDGLIFAGEQGQQLTWMDAKIGDWVVTPRHGKPVEINALWYNALQVITRLAGKYRDNNNDLDSLAAVVRNNFINRFWNPEKKRLYDLVNGSSRDESIRPNQIFAVSLPFSPLDHGKQVHVVNTVWRELYFSYGLRSLAPTDSEYHGKYQGDVVRRDSAYHRGTGWGWLAGPFITAFRKVHDYSHESKVIAERFIAPFKAHLREHGVGSISEVFDGDPPHLPRGCFSQAWSVAEVLRAYVEDILMSVPNKGGKNL
ncbi:amylo-alpha-1,6-glucosidase [Phosphitispora sp. TUW77]|uniref:amylo-alpha-1,6-glucosidase n=1 Tax=Phosphitispora sp. TUW77 TaxID=3152361 RepID=UPI003AB35122